MSKDTSMEYLTQNERRAILQKNLALTEEDFLKMDPVEFRARVRERSHHTLEIQVYQAAYRNKTLSEKQADYTKWLLEIWKKKGLSEDLPEYSRLVTYVDVGYGDQTPYPPQRWDVKDTILARI